MQLNNQTLEIFKKLYYLGHHEGMKVESYDSHQ